MLEQLFGGLIDKEQAIADTMQSTLESVATELKCDYKDFFVMVRPTNDKFDSKFYIYKLENGVPKPIRELTLKEIVGD